jgi:hypothetical protein
VGGIHGTGPFPVFLLLVIAAYVLLVGPSLVERSGSHTPAMLAVARRARLLALTPLAGTGVLIVLFVAQLRTLGTSGYYFVKFFMGLELVLAAIVPAVCAVLVVWVLPSRLRRAQGLLLTAAATLLATQAFGLTVTPVPLLDPSNPGTATMQPPFSTARVASGILSAARASDTSTSFDRDYLAIGPDRAGRAFYPDGWYHGIYASLSSRTMSRLNILTVPTTTVREAAPAARQVLRRNPRLVLIVDPRFLASLRNQMGSPDLARRIAPWTSVQAEGER